MGSPDIESIADGLLRTRNAEVNLAFRVQGEGPAVVLLHGTTANHAVWTSVADDLTASATVISLDQRGHGRSDKPADGYTGSDFAADVVTVLDALGVEQALVGGHSLGGRNAWVAAALHPDRVTGALVVDYTPFVERQVLDELDARVAGGFRSFQDLDEIHAYLRGRYPRILVEAVERRARWGYRQAPDGSWQALADAGAMRQLIEGFRTPWLDEFEAVRVPMTHLRGADSRIVTPAAWAAAQEARPGDRWIEIAGADHYIPEEHPERITAELLRLLSA